MRVQIFLAVTNLLVQSASAQTPAPSPTLSANMDSINTLVNTITKNVSDTTQNASSAAAAGRLVTLFTTAFNQTPNSIAALPTTQQAAAMSGYQSLIQKEIADAQSLEKAFLANNNSGASTILQDMNTIKSQGHSTYAK